MALWCWLNYCLWRKRLMTCATSCALRFPRGSVAEVSFHCFFLNGPLYERFKRNDFDELMWNPADWLLTFNWMIERGNSFIHKFLPINHGQETTSSVCLVYSKASKQIAQIHKFLLKTQKCITRRVKVSLNYGRIGFPIIINGRYSKLFIRYTVFWCCL